MLKKLLYSLAFLLMATTTFGTHNRAGEITYRQIGPTTIEVTITTYTKIDAPADRCELEIFWGDGNSSILDRINGNPQGGCDHWGEPVFNNIKKNIYVGTYTYATPGTYRLTMLDNNRNEGVKNIPNSVRVPFFIESSILLAAELENNSSPVLLNPPTDFGCVFTPFIHNLGAFDADGDSLGFKLVNSRGINGDEIPETYDPEFNLDFDHISINEEGTIMWDAPNTRGEFNLAVEITEYRQDQNGTWLAIGKILRDMQIDITDCDNTPPTIEAEDEYCIIAGDTLEFDVLFDDPDGDNLTVSAVGGPFQIEPAATFEFRNIVPPPVTSTFRWETDCSLLRTKEYSVTFKANDWPVGNNGTPLPGLAAQKVVKIKLKLPGPDNLVVQRQDQSFSFDLNWEYDGGCDAATGYKVYRREHTGDFEIEDCTEGVPASSGYQLIATINDVDQKSFTDDNGGQPFKIGLEYCYVVTAIAEDLNMESSPSNPDCDILPKVVPLITHASVENTSMSNGEVYLEWSKPTEFDAVTFPGPYIYKVLYHPDATGTFNEIGQTPSINDTTFNHVGINTFERIHTYRIDHFDLSESEERFVGSSFPANTPFLRAAASDERVVLSVDGEFPWGIDSIQYYREIDQTLTFEYLGTVIGRQSFSDEGLINDQEYCYQAITYGSYGLTSVVKPLINNSQIACATPEDNVVECPPELEVPDQDEYCTEGQVELRWRSPSDICDAKNVVDFLIYFSPTGLEVDYELIATVTDTSYVAPTTQGFYRIAARDDVGNLSDFSIVIQIESCNYFILPNVFTPNGDGINDLFTPVEGSQPPSDLTIMIFNRWGGLVYETDDPMINWDGLSSQTGKECADGVYFYKCEFTIMLEDQAPMRDQLSGTIHLFRELP